MESDLDPATSDERTVVSCMCPCGKEVKRTGQRNGLKCHAKANREYRARVKLEGERIRAIIQRIDKTA